MRDLCLATLGAVLLAVLGGCGKGLLPLSGSGTGSPSELARGALDPTFQINGIGTPVPGSVPPFILNGGAARVSAQGFLLEYYAVNSLTVETDLGAYKLKPDGSVDSSFGTNGLALVSTTTGLANEVSYDAFFLRNGKVLITGRGVPTPNLLFARVTSMGAIDSSFDVDGISMLTHGGTSWFGGAIVEDPEGRIVSVGGIGDALVTRLLSDGGFDPSFDTDGVVTTNIGGGGGTEAYTSVAFQTDGKIIAAGLEGVGAAQDMVLARYTSTGALDASYGVSGILSIDFDGNADFIAAMAIQSDGKIVAAGQKTSAGGTDTDFAIIRVLTNGTLDPSFSGDGMATFDFGFTNESVRAMTLDSLGRAIIGGAAGSQYALLVVNTDGTLDSGFGSEGLVRESASTTVLALGLDSDGKILTVGDSFAAPTIMRHIP